MKPFVTILLIVIGCAVLFLFISACAPSLCNLDNHIGLYRVTGKECIQSEGLISTCEEMRFIELVRGRFHGIGPDELALVLWRMTDEDPELLYEAWLVKNHRTIQLEADRIWIKKSAGPGLSEKEYFTLADDGISGYTYQLQKKNKASTTSSRSYHYTLSPTDRSRFPDYKLTYPED